MEKRKHKRFKIQQLAMICGEVGILKDMSNQGVQAAASLLPRYRKIDISFEAYGEMIYLTGSVQWIRRKSSLNNLNRFGIFLQDPPPQYHRFVKSLC